MNSLLYLLVCSVVLVRVISIVLIDFVEYLVKYKIHRISLYHPKFVLQHLHNKADVTLMNRQLKSNLLSVYMLQSKLLIGQKVVITIFDSRFSTCF